MTAGEAIPGAPLLVSPRSRLDAVIASHRPERIVSLQSPGAEPFAAAGFQGAVLRLAFNDVAEDREGMVSPAIGDVAALLGFARAWTRAAPLLIHCYAGISRSTAAALVVAAALAPERGEGELAKMLRALAPEATPNPYLVRLADAVLKRQGRLVAAAAEIGRGAEAFEGRPFVWRL